MFDYRNLDIWKRSFALSVAIAQATKGRSRCGPPGLASQLTRAIASVPANIAEGAGYSSPLQTARFMDTAVGSLNETENHLAASLATGLLAAALVAEFTAEVQALRRMIAAFKCWVLRNS